MSGQAIAFMMDSNVSHEVAADDSLRTALREAVDRGDIRLLVTHIQVDENLNHPDHEAGRRLIHAMMATGVRAIPTYGFVLDVSRLDNARLFDEATAAMFEAFVQGNPDHAEDGLLAATALHEGAILVTGENEQHRRRVERHFRGLQVWTPDDLRQHVAPDEAEFVPQPGSVASGTLSTAPFDGPGETTSAITLRTGGLLDPQLTISLALEPLSLGATARIGTKFTYSIASERAEETTFSVTVKRQEHGEERGHVFAWKLAAPARRSTTHGLA